MRLPNLIPKLQKQPIDVKRTLVVPIALLFFSAMFFVGLLSTFEIAENTRIYIMLFYAGSFLTVFLVFKKFLRRWYLHRGFLTWVKIILHPLPNIILVSVIFTLKAGNLIGSDLYYCIIGLWIILFSFFALNTVFIWFSSFIKKENPIQIFWIYRKVKEIVYLYIFTGLSLILGAIVVGISTAFRFYNIVNLQTLTPTELTFFEPIINVYLSVISYIQLVLYYFLILGSILLVVIFVIRFSDTNMKLYCKTLLELVKNKFTKKEGQRIVISTEEYVHVFPDVIGHVNLLLKSYHNPTENPEIFISSIPPRIINKDAYPKKLFMSEITKYKRDLNNQDKKRLKDVKDGLDTMSESMDIDSDKFLYPFLEGLRKIANSGETRKRLNFEDVFELKKPTFAMRVKENRWLIGLIIPAIFGSIHIILTILKSWI